MFDLQYGLPVEIRDKFLGENKITVPTEESNKNYWAQIASENIENLALPYEKNETSHPILEKIARTTPYYERNRAHVCTFWLRGECTRGALCAYGHRAPEENAMNQNIKDRFHGVNDPVAKKILNQIENSKYLKAPEDKSIKTIVISYVDETLVNDIEVILKAYGSIDDFTLIKNHAFVTYSKRAAAEDSIKNIFTSLIIKGKKLNVVWTKKVDEKVDVSSKVHMRCHDYNLLPAFDFNLRTVSSGPRPPTKPPVDNEKKEDQDNHLLNGLHDKKPSYQTMRSDNQGGKKL